MRFFSRAESAPSEEIPPEQEHLPHLKEGVPCIMACVGTPEQFKKNPGAEQVSFNEIRQDMPRTHDVDFFGEHERLVQKNFKNPQEGSYVISSIDNLDKVSRGFKNCTGLVVAGYDKTTGENISFFSHENPKYFLVNRSKFSSDLRQGLIEIRERCIEGTIDAAIVGGNYAHPPDSKHYREVQKNYLASIGLLSGEVEKILGFSPVVITGPKTIPKREDDIFYENKDRRLYISRPEVGKSTAESFYPKAIKSQEKKWLAP